MKKLINSIRHTYYNSLINLSMGKIKTHLNDDKLEYWVGVLCKYATKTVEIES